MPIYCKFENITGDVLEAGFEGCIAVESFHFAASRQIDMHAESPIKREAGKPMLSEVSMNRLAGGLMPVMLKSVLAAVAGIEIVLSHVYVEENTINRIITVRLSNCYISSYSVSFSTDGQPYENITIAYSAIDISSDERGGESGKNKLLRTGYDIRRHAIVNA